MRLLICEAKKLHHSFSMTLMIIITVSLTLLLILSGTNVQLYMVAGPGLDSALPEKIGGSIGFISNAIDPTRVGDSVLRTAFSYTVFWIPISIFFSASFYSMDFRTHSIQVSKAHGTSITGIILAKSISIFSIQSLLYCLHCICTAYLKAIQFGVDWQTLNFNLFFSIALTNLLLLEVLSSETILLYTLFQNTFSCVIILFIYHACVLCLYPNSFSRFPETLGVGRLFYQSSPVYYLMNSCSLSFEYVTLTTSLCYGSIMVLLLITSTVLISKYCKE